MSKKKDTSFLIQGSILAIASIVSRVIGLVYRIPLTAIIGDHGNDYYSTAFEIYSLILLLSSYSLPMAVSKMVSARNARRERRNAYRVFQGALVFSAITGAIGALFIFLCAGPLTELFKTPMAVYALRVLSPTLVIVAVMAVIRGFFQGMGTMVPSAISQVIEQIVNAVVSVGAAYVLYAYGMRIAAATGSGKDYPAAFGAAGGTIGTGAGSLAGLIFVIFVYFLFRPSLRRAIRKEERRAEKQGAAPTESYRSIVKILVFTIVPVLLSTTVYNLVSIVDQGIFKNFAAFQNYDASTVSTWWGVFAGKYRVLVNVPISIASALAVSAVPTLSAAFARGERRQVQRRIGLSLRFEMVVAFPCAVGLFVLASPIQQLLFHDSSRLAAGLMMLGACSVIFYSISTLSNAVLQAIDQMRTPVINAVISLIVQVVAIFISMFVFDLKIYSVVIANIVFSLVMCILNGRAVQKHSGFRPEVMKTFVKPALAAVIMGIVTLGAYMGIHKVTGHNSIACVAAILVAMIVYSVALLLTKALTEEELKSFPKGTVIIRFAKKLHLL
ncbi:MAG: polysaccharide biosynthesis protein [Lachnospiraceae bacterium]|jgi:stage V sporulation protein B|uniref:putative polysaccharide biosynthesis protein n=1 Tax=Clostridium sp. (strain SY8519) TaxID=1042156 RepID=UPI0002171E59|nr:polysaccharide biosynthesis protein [Clostridium sp. SY8519]MCI1654621.1 polysaccharide biosynthesis protein [Lachnospiraceae bacterium]MCI1656892.1 polysaccharide biosynthesis protein [Lachnospiraceae bacterium]MCI2195372.1 polysaccharide biosynthesis protein [Lachnospiraceae bacterium]BAK48199.1 hypothetical protein CXIVA_22320 [Clostridium sp. SY8519]HAD19602.1 polysaccharide biosynthesis protein [Lachnospiraceae bacterium]